MNPQAYKKVQYGYHGKNCLFSERTELNQFEINSRNHTSLPKPSVRQNISKSIWKKRSPVYTVSQRKLYNFQLEFMVKMQSMQY